jgi:hypothetical protein
VYLDGLLFIWGVVPSFPFAVCAKVSYFCDFLIHYTGFWTRMKMTMHETPAHGQAVRSPTLKVKV